MERNDSRPSRTEPCKHWQIYRTRSTASGRGWSEVNFQGRYYTKRSKRFSVFDCTFFWIDCGSCDFCHNSYCRSDRGFYFSGYRCKSRFTLHLRNNITKCIRSSSCGNKLKQQVCPAWRNTCLCTNDFIRSLHGTGFDGYFYGLRNDSCKRHRQRTKRILVRKPYSHVGNFYTATWIYTLFHCTGC